MLRTRVIPALLLQDRRLVKTVNFRAPVYIGDPCNTVRIFNECEVDELAFIDIAAARGGPGPDFTLLGEIADECFMPLSYGGGIRSFDQAKKILRLGFEKVIINSHAVGEPGLITQVARHFGAQAVIGGIDVSYRRDGRPTVRTLGGQGDTGLDPVTWAQELERRGAGEILLTCIDREGTWQGYALDLVRAVASGVGIPLIAHGGAGTLQDIGAVIHEAGASAAAVGSMVVFQKKGMGVLVNFPSEGELATVLGRST